jgi:hypothetical protein
MCVYVCVVHFQVIFTDIVYVAFFQCVQVFPFLCVLMMSIVSVMVLYLYPVFNMWSEYPELLLLFLIACICSLYLVWTV